MPTPIDPKRLPNLRRALKKVKDGDKLPQQELAKIFGVTNARFTTLAHNRFTNFPPAERHGDKTHWYDARKAIESMIAYVRGQSSRSRVSAQRVAKILGRPVPIDTGNGKAKPAGEPEVPEDDPEPEYMPTPADLDRLAKAETSVFRLEQEKGNFIPVYQVRHVIQGIVAIVSRTFSGLAPEIDPHGELPPPLRAKLEKAIKQSQLKLHDSVIEYLDADAA